MTIALSYDGTLGRVQIDLSSLQDGTVQIQRSLNASATDALWEQQIIRGALELPVSSGAATAHDPEFHADVSNHYRVVPVDPPAGLLLDGNSGDYASTPDDASLDITGDIDLRAEVVIDDWTASAADGVRSSLVAKWLSPDRSFAFTLENDGTPSLFWSADGTTSIVRNATAVVPVSAGRLALRAVLDVDNGSSGHTVTFYTASTIDGGWTQLGDPVVTAGTTSIFSGTAAVEIGALDGGTARRLAGTVRRVEVRDGIDGTVVAAPDFAAQDTGTTSFDDSEGLTWTVNGDAEILGPVLETDSITPDLAGRVWLKSITYPSLNIPVTPSDYGPISLPSRSTAFGVSGRSLPLGVTDHSGGRNHPLVLATDDDEGASKLDAIIRTGGTLFVHVPATAPAGLAGNLLLPGSMYVILDTAGITRLGGVSDHQHYVLPVAEVVKPGPDVVGTTLTWGTVERLYGSWEALVAAHPSWASLLATVGSPEDLVVL